MTELDEVSAEWKFAWGRGLVHGNRGRPAPNQVAELPWSQIIALARGGGGHFR